MSFRKTYDLAVRVGSYTDRDGKEKGRYENVGYILEGDSGQRMICVKRTFSPAGVPNPDARDTVVLSAFDVRDQGPNAEQRNEVRRSDSAPAASTRTPAVASDFNDDIPF